MKLLPTLACAALIACSVNAFAKTPSSTTKDAKTADITLNFNQTWENFPVEVYQYDPSASTVDFKHIKHIQVPGASGYNSDNVFASKLSKIPVGDCLRLAYPTKPCPNCSITLSSTSVCYVDALQHSDAYTNELIEGDATLCVGGGGDMTCGGSPSSSSFSYK